MLNEGVGTAVSIDGRSWLKTMLGCEGHAVYGPYEALQAGRYVVNFDILDGAEGECDDEDIVAGIDVVSAFGSHQFATTYLTKRDLGSLSLVFDLAHPTEGLEYRVYTSGIRSLLIGVEPKAVRDDGATLPSADQVPGASDQVSIRNVLRLLKPHRLVEHNKVRVGNEHDGGYVMVDDFDVDVALSLGINDDITWDVAVANRGLKVYQFDHTVADPAPDDDRMVFSPTMIASQSGEGRISLEDLARRHAASDRIILKMDIEGWEWEAFETLERVDAFSQIVCELHYFEGLVDVLHRTRVRRALKKINEHYVVVHIHGNSCAGLTTMHGLSFPCVMEVTFANRNLYPVEETLETFPSSMDQSCDPKKPDLWLGTFTF